MCRTWSPSTSTRGCGTARRSPSPVHSTSPSSPVRLWPLPVRPVCPVWALCREGGRGWLEACGDLDVPCGSSPPSGEAIHPLSPPLRQNGAAVCRHRPRRRRQHARPPRRSRSPGGRQVCAAAPRRRPRRELVRGRAQGPAGQHIGAGHTEQPARGMHLPPARMRPRPHPLAYARLCVPPTTPNTAAHVNAHSTPCSGRCPTTSAAATSCCSVSSPPCFRTAWSPWWGPSGAASRRWPSLQGARYTHNRGSLRAPHQPTPPHPSSRYLCDRRRFDGVVFVRLRRWDVGECVWSRAAQVLSLGSYADDPGSVHRRLKSMRVLLVLDNCEHVLATARGPFQAFLIRALEEHPRMKVRGSSAPLAVTLTLLTLPTPLPTLLLPAGAAHLVRVRGPLRVHHRASA